MRIGTRKWAWLSALPVLLAACASTPANLKGDYAEVSPAQGSDARWQGTTVRWGGVVVGVRLTDVGECAEIAQFQLDRFTYQPYRVFPGGADGLHHGVLATVSLAHAESAPRFLACDLRAWKPDASRVGAVVTLVGALQPALVFKVRGQNCLKAGRFAANATPDYSGTMHATDDGACFISLPTLKVTASRTWPEGPSQHLASIR